MTGASGGQGQGQGGVGTPDGTGQAGQERTRDEVSVFDPTAESTEELDIGGTATGDQTGEVVGEGNASNAGSVPLIPLSEVLPTYEQRAVDALDSLQIAPSDRALVRGYFDALSAQ